jgi:hypothetical protein
MPMTDATTIGSDAADAAEDMAPVPFYGAVPLDSGLKDAPDGG